MEMNEKELGKIAGGAAQVQGEPKYKVGQDIVLDNSTNAWYRGGLNKTIRATIVSVYVENGEYGYRIRYRRVNENVEHGVDEKVIDKYIL